MEQISTYSKMNAHLLTHTHISRMALYAAFLFIGVMCSVGNAWADVTDNITVSDLAATNTTYTNFSNVSKSSDAKYAGNTAKGNSVIQLRSTNPCGIVSTTSGGLIKSVSVTWDGNTVDGRHIEVYGSNTAYAGSSDLYDNSKKGVLLGTITKGTTTPLTVVGDFKYIGLKSNNTNTFITKFSITWTDADDPLDYVYNLVTDVSDLAAGDRVIILNTGGTYAMSTTQNTNNRAGVAAAANNWSINDAGTRVTLGASTTVEVMTVGRLNNHWIFVTGTGYLRAAGNSSNNYLKTNASTDTYCEWAISLNGSNEASIVGEGDNTNKTMQFYSNHFACYASATNTAIKIYKQEPPTYTVTWSAGSEEEFYTQTDVAGTALEDPGTPTAGTYCPGGKVFVGWTETPIAGEDDDAPADLFTSVSGKSIQEGGTTYYAVFATSSGGSPTFSGYEKVTSAPDDWTVDTYVLATDDDGYVLNGKAAGGNYGAEATMSTSTQTNSWEITIIDKDGGIYALKQGNKYLAITTNGNSLYFESDYSAAADGVNNCDWNIFSNGGGYSVRSTVQMTQSKTTDYRVIKDNHGSTRFAGYVSGQTEAYLYKKVMSGGASYSAYATTCSVTYDIVLDDGEVATTNNGSAKVAADAKELTDITAPTKTGYKVAKYTTGNGSGSDIADKDGKLNASVSVSATVWTNSSKEWKKGSGATFYASWTPISYSVRFNANDEGKTGTASGSMSNQDFDYGTAQNLTTNAFSLTGYTFQGWATSAGGSVAHTDGKSVSNLSTTDGDVVDLYAVWQANTYDVTLAATDETSSVGSQVVTATYGSSMPTTLKGSGDVDAPERTGYTFTGWEYSSTTYYDYNAGTSTLSSAHVWDVADEVELSPKWSAITYTITYHLNSGTNPGGVPTEYTIESSDITLPTPTRSGYNFNGWYADEDLSTGGVHTTIASGSTGNKEYWAKWTAKTLTSISLAEDAVTIYDQQYVLIDVIYDPSDILTKGYTLTGPSLTKVVTTGSTNAQLKISATKSGVVINSQVSETVSIKANADNTKTTSVTVTINPLPRVHFVDLVHGKEFADVKATIAENTLNPDKTTKTSVDWTTPNANDCEGNHLHLVGWIREDWPALVAYLNGTGGQPETGDITGAGNDGSGKAYFFEPNASINVLTFDGVTFYAVWSKIE